MRILLVDDNAVQREVRSAVLSRAGFEVVSTSNGKEASLLLQAPEMRTMFSLLITDHFMPEMAGPELVQAVRSLLPEIPILVLSGSADAETEYDHQAVVFRIKPFPPAELVRLARHLLGAEALQTA